MDLKLFYRFALLFGISSFSVFSQENPRSSICHSTVYEQHINSANEKSVEKFEQWIAAKIADSKLQKNGNSSPLTLPVVVHIIHDGDAVGVSENIPDERIFSQITVINQDFGHLQGTPGNVEGNAGVNTDIQFCLAQQDPQGNPTNGIDRQNLGKASWNSMEVVDTDMKAATMWDPSKYINIWVCRFGGQLSQVGGYSYFPEESGLDGLEEGTSNAGIDGVVMSFKAFGSSDTFPSTTYFPGSDKGRSLTHELGHFFGLRHIWGDGTTCEASDYCDDTPACAGVHFECVVVDTCPDDSFTDMIENHMDYTPDTCKSIFTQGQKDRMWAVLQNSPRRISLATSNACQSPTASINDFDHEYKIRLYPNPAGPELNIKTDNNTEIYEYEIFSPLGLRILNGILEQDTAINIQSLPQGVYIIILKGKSTEAHKFIKQ